MGKSSSKLSKKIATQIANETLFTESEIQEWYDGFIADCPDGKVFLGFSLFCSRTEEQSCFRIGMLIHRL